MKVDGLPQGREGKGKAEKGKLIFVHQLDYFDSQVGCIT